MPPHGGAPSWEPPGGILDLWRFYIMKKKILVVFLICCMFLGVASPAFAADSLPPLPSLRDGGYIIGTERLSGDLVFLTWDSFIKVYYDTDGGVLVFNGDDPNNGRYTVSTRTLSDDGSEWANASSFKLGGSIGDKTYYFTNPVDGNVLIKDQNGLVFFSAPLLLNLGIMEVKMSPLANQVVGMIQTLLPYGISCLALLISLPLLSKVLRRFLN